MCDLLAAPWRPSSTKRTGFGFRLCCAPGWSRASGSFATFISYPRLLAHPALGPDRRRVAQNAAARPPCDLRRIVCVAYLCFAAVLMGARGVPVTMPSANLAKPSGNRSDTPSGRTRTSGSAIRRIADGIEWNDAISTEFVRWKLSRCSASLAVGDQQTCGMSCSVSPVRIRGWSAPDVLGEVRSRAHVACYCLRARRRRSLWLALLIGSACSRWRLWFLILVPVLLLSLLPSLLDGASARVRTRSWLGRVGSALVLAPGAG